MKGVGYSSPTDRCWTGKARGRTRQAGARHCRIDWILKPIFQYQEMYLQFARTYSNTHESHLGGCSEP
jgi:hypothetical protein